MKRFICVLLCIAMLFSFAGCEAGKKTQDGPDGTGPSDEQSAAPTISAEDASRIVMNTENYSLTLAEFNLIFVFNYSNFLYNWSSTYGSSYSEYLKSAVGLDISKPLKDQMLKDNSASFLSYFIESAKTEAKTMLLLCEYAHDNGIELTEEEKKAVAEGVASYSEAAEQNNSTVAELLGDSMGITTIDVIASYSEKNNLAQKASYELSADFKFTDEEIDEEFKSNPKEYAVVNYLVYTFEPGDSVSAETAKKCAEELSQTTSKEDFLAYAENYYNNVLNAGTTSAAPFNASNYEKNNIGYSEGSDYLEWMFSGATDGECHIVSDEEHSIYNVYFLISAPSENEYYLKNVRHILFKSTSFENADACKAEAERVLALYNEDPTEEHFAALANEYSEDRQPDETEKTDGGLYENVDYNQMVSEFEKWTFDDARANGDTGIIRTSYGYHIMYFAGNGEHVRVGHKNAELGLNRVSYSAELEKLETAHAITVDDAQIAKIER